MNEQQQVSSEILRKQLGEAKVQFERALECKHTEFDDLYPYMMEHPQFFWYKRYVAWSELLTVIKICESLAIDWEDHFSKEQAQYVQKRVMSSQVLDEWFEKN